MTLPTGMSTNSKATRFPSARAPGVQSTGYKVQDHMEHNKIHVLGVGGKGQGSTGSRFGSAATCGEILISHPEHRDAKTKFLRELVGRLRRSQIIQL